MKENKLQQMMTNLICTKQKIIENEYLENENVLAQKDINDLKKLLNTSKKYINKKKKLKINCILRLILGSMISFFCSHICVISIGFSSINNIIIPSILLFISFYSTFICIFYKDFHNYLKIKKFIKSNNINKIDIEIKKLEHKIKFNKEMILENNKKINKFHLQVNSFEENLQNIENNNNIEYDSGKIETAEYNKVKTLKMNSNA